VAPGENVIQMGEDIRSGDPLLPQGHTLKPQDIGGLMALGIVEVTVAAAPRVAILSTGDEVVPPASEPAMGQVRDVNTYTVSALVARAGGIPVPLGIAPDRFDATFEAARSGLAEADALVISAGSSVSMRDLTARVVDAIGRPGVLVHGVSVRPGKPTILGVCGGKPVLGLPGNPVSAFVVSRLFLDPLVRHLQGCTVRSAWPERVSARLAQNVASAAGREDYVPVRLVREDGELVAHPIFGKSNLIYTLVHATGLLRIPLDSGGLHRGDTAEVEPL
jgi:molybdopterin molybdotransferase